MPMPPYLRFPENESVQQKIWGLSPRNPTCGKISLETGTKIYAWANIIIYGFFTTLTAVVLAILIFSYSSYPSHQELIQGLKSKQITSGQIPDDWVEKLATKQSHSLLLCIMFASLIVSSLLLSVNWSLKKAVVERNVTSLKKCFYILFIMDFLYLIFFLVESEIIWTKSLFFDVPFALFEICGLIFIYSFIVSLINPDNSQNEDLNRIQFSP